MATTRDNEFIIDIPNVSDLAFGIHDSSITKGQDFNGINWIRQDGSRWIINIRAGRKGNSGVADWFKSKITGGEAVGCDSADRLPDSLNFACVGTLSFTNPDGTRIVIREVVIGQGHNARNRNNWWFGNKFLSRSNGKALLRNEFADKSVNFKIEVSPSGVNTFVIRQNLAVRDWMSKLDGKSKLTELSIPGTHDSGTQKSVAFGTAHCQNFSIKRQLEEGIRFLDVRLSNQKLGIKFDNLYLTHGIISCDISFGQVLDWCRSFLNAHPHETIMMSVKAENDNGDISPEFKPYLKKNQDLFYHDNTIPALKDVRGKIVLFYRFALRYAPGEEIVQGWEYSKAGIDITHWEENTYFAINNNQGQKFQVEDHFESYDTHKKVAEVKSALERAMTGDRQTFYITFNSVAWGPGHHTAYQYAWGGLGVNPAMNVWLGGFFRNRGKQRYGAILLDYYNNEGDDMQLVHDIVRSNFSR